MAKNIAEFVWKFVDTDIALKKDISRGIINIRSLAKYIIQTQKLDASPDSVISALRRYKTSIKKSEESNSVHAILKQARISIKTKMSSLLLKRTDSVKTKLGRPDRMLDFQDHDIIRVLEGSEALTIVIDQKNLDKAKNTKENTRCIFNNIQRACRERDKHN